MDDLATEKLEEIAESIHEQLVEHAREAAEEGYEYLHVYENAEQSTVPGGFDPDDATVTFKLSVEPSDRPRPVTFEGLSHRRTYELNPEGGR